jgi:hypothetical protein
MGSAVFDDDRLSRYADQWRSLARAWTRRAKEEQNPHAATLRHAAQMALYAAYEAERLLRSRSATGRVPVSRRRSEPTLAGAGRRHDPIRYGALPGPVALAGQRPRSGPYSGRQASRLG